MLYSGAYSLEFSESVASLDQSLRSIVQKRIEKVLLHLELGKPLHGRPRRYAERFLHYRIIYEIEGTRIYFVRLGKRDEIYRPYAP